MSYPAKDGHTGVPRITREPPIGDGAWWRAIWLAIAIFAVALLLAR